MSNRILIVSPHCDDAEIGCGGYLHQEAVKGAVVRLLIGTVGSVYFRHLNRTVEAEERLLENTNAMNRLCFGSWSRGVLSHDKDGELNTVPMHHLVSAIDAEQDEFRPDTILIPLPSSHQDHEFMHRVCIASTRTSRHKHKPGLIASYEYPAISWGGGAAANSAQGGMYVDISQALSAKRDALAEYKSQMRPGQDQLSVEGVAALAKLRGIEAGFDYAELFHVMRLRVFS